MFILMARYEQNYLDEPRIKFDNFNGIYIEKLIENSKRRGTIRKDIDNDIIKMLILAISNGLNERWISIHDGDFSKEISKELEQIMLNEFEQMIKLLKEGIVESDALGCH